jgi:hypothetical protein
MRRAIRVAVVVSCFVAAEEEAAAQSSKMTMSGADLLKACTIADHEWIGFCNGYLQAAFDAGGGKGICAPKGVTRNQLFDIIIPKLQTAPALLELDAVSVINALLRRRIPATRLGNEPSSRHHRRVCR